MNVSWRKLVCVSGLLIALPLSLDAQDKSRYGKLSSELDRLATAAERGERLSARGSRWMDEARQTVTAVLELAPQASVADVTAAVRSAGGSVEASSGELVKIELPVRALRTLSNHPGILRMRTPFKPNQKLTSQGVDTIHAPDYRSRTGADGTGVVVGILDTGFSGASGLIDSGELSSDTLATPFVLDRLSTMTDVHGSACAEVIHDVAPGATLVLASFEDDVTWAAAVDDLLNSGVDIISHSVGFDNLFPPDGNHFFAQKVDEANARGVLFVTAAGNEAGKYFQGPWRDDNANGYLDVTGGGEILPIVVEGAATVVLRWDDTFGASFHDYDLFVVTEAFLGNPDLSDGNPAILAASADLQSGSQNPIERVDFEHDGIGLIVVRHDPASPIPAAQRFWVWSSAGIDPSQGTGTGTLTLPADARGSVAVAAVGFDTRGLQGYSSRGPTADGRVKPDVAGPDGVSTVSLEPFHGTSAATPHISGAAALLLSANPGMSVSDLRRALEEAVDLLGYPSRNNDIGAGLVDLHRAR
jgi:subtilisin family serine protease